MRIPYLLLKHDNVMQDCESIAVQHVCMQIQQIAPSELKFAAHAETAHRLQDNLQHGNAAVWRSFELVENEFRTLVCTRECHHAGTRRLP